MNQADWIERLGSVGALWMHDGKPDRPHPLLTSGAHSNGFFNGELIRENPLLLSMACEHLLDLLCDTVRGYYPIDRVVGPAMGAITMAHEVARQYSQRFRLCFSSYVEKDPNDSARMRFARTGVVAGETVLVVEDVLTTGGSVERTIAAVENAGGSVAPWIMVIVNRSGVTHLGDRRILALVNKELPIWQPDDCPLCAQGSEAIRPKDKENWARLNAA